MTFSNVSSFNNTYKALSATNIAKESASTIKKGGAFAPNFAETTSIMRASLDNQWENAYIIKYQALMQNRLNALKQELTAAYNNLLQQSTSQQIRENGSNNSVSATTDVYGRMLPGSESTTTLAAPGTFVAGTTVLKVASVAGFQADDSLSVGGNNYYVSGVNTLTNEITISSGLVSAQAVGDIVKGGRNEAFKGLKYYDDQAALDLADYNGVWDKPGDNPLNSATAADGIPSYYTAIQTRQYNNSSTPINVKTENVEMRKLYVSGPAMQIANDMKVTFRSEEVVPKAVDNSSFLSGVLGGIMPPSLNPPFKAGEKVAEYSTEVKTGGFWSTINYLYNFSPRELKYAYATSYSTTTEESGTRNYTDDNGTATTTDDIKRQATLYTGKMVDARDMQANSSTATVGTIQTDEDATTPTLNGTTALPSFGARAKWVSSTPEDGYLTERNTLIDLNNANDKQDAASYVSTSIDDRLITRRTSDNDNNFPYLATLFNNANDIVKGNATDLYNNSTTILASTDPLYNPALFKPADPWSGFMTSPTNSPDQRENTIKLLGTEEGGVTSMDTRIKWEYQHDGNGVLDTNRDAYIIGNNLSSTVTVPIGGGDLPTIIPAGGLSVTLPAGKSFAYYNLPSTTPVIVTGTATIPAGASTIVPANGIDITSAQNLTLSPGNSFKYDPGATVVAASASAIVIPAGASGTLISGAIPSSGVTLHASAGFTYSTTGTGADVTVSAGPVTIPAGSTGTISAGSTITVPAGGLAVPPTGITVNSVPAASPFSINLPTTASLPIPSSGVSGIKIISIPSPSTFAYKDSGGVTITLSSTSTFPHTIPAGSTIVDATIPAGSQLTIPGGATNIVMPAGSAATIPPNSIVTAPTGGLSIPTTAITVNSVAASFTYTPAAGPSTISVLAGQDVTIPAGATGVIPVGSTYRIPMDSVIKLPDGTTYILDVAPTTGSGTDAVHVATAAFINHYQVAVQKVELNSNPDSYGKVLALGHTRNPSINDMANSTLNPYDESVDPMNAVASKIFRSGGIDASMEYVFSDYDDAYDTQGKLIHQGPVDKDGNGQTTNEKMMLPGSGKIAKNFTPAYVEGLHQINSFNGQSLGANGGNVTISSETANSTPVILGEYEGFKRAQTMSIGLAHDIYNDFAKQATSYQSALDLKKKLEAEVNASSMVDTDWHYAEYASSAGGVALDGIMFRNIKKVAYSDPDKGIGELNIYYNRAITDDPNGNTHLYVDPATGLQGAIQGTADDSFDNINVAFRKVFNLTREQFQTLEYKQVNPTGSNPVEKISPDTYANAPSYKSRTVNIDVDTQNVDMNTLDLIVNGNVVTPTAISLAGGTATYDIASYLQEGDNVIAFQMKIDKTVGSSGVGKSFTNVLGVETGQSDYFKLGSTSTNDNDIASWISSKISTTQSLTGDAGSTELTSSINTGVNLSSWQSKIMANEVRPSLYESIYPSNISNPRGSDPAKFLVDEFTGQVTAVANPTGTGFYIPGTTTTYTAGVNDIPMTEQAYNSYGDALMGLGSNKTATKVKDSNTFLKILMEAMNKKEYQDIFALGLLSSSLGKDMIIKGNVASPSGGNIQSTLNIKYDNINNKFILVQTKWDASGAPQQS